MERRTRILSHCWRLLVSSVTIAGLCACQQQSTVTKPADTTLQALVISNEAADKMQLATDTVGMRQLSKTLHVPGRVQAEVSKEVEVSPRFSGRIVNILVAPGAHVNAGQVLADVDSTAIGEMQAELVKATAELAIAQAHEDRERQVFEENKLHPKNLIEAKTTYESAKVQLTLAESDFKRVSSLYKEKISSMKDFLAAQAHLEHAKVDFKASESELRRQENLYKNQAIMRRDLQLAEAETSRAKQHVNTLKQQLSFVNMSPEMIADIQKTGRIRGVVPIVSPQGGVVTDQHVAVGEMVGPDDKCFTVVDLSTVVVTAEIPEVDCAQVHMGNGVHIHVPAYPHETFDGDISFISQAVDAKTRAVPIRIKLQNPGLKLKSNMFADIDLPGIAEELLCCPKDAIQQRGDKKVVYARTASGAFEEHTITTGEEFERYVEIVDGVTEGTTVATKGSLLLKTAMSAPQRDVKD